MRLAAAAVGLGALAAALSACVSAIPRATEDDLKSARARYGGAVTVADLDADRTVYAARGSLVARVNRSSSRSRMGPDAWPGTVADMGKRGGIAQDDLARIERYLVTMSGRPKR